ncbi:MAG: PQQ-binding-like beta-propeller repeat protein [Planctomycetota bacterium]
MWETTILEQGSAETHASPAIADGRVFVHTAAEVQYEEGGKTRKRSSAVLVCVALADGRELWRHQGDGGCHNTPCVAGDKVLYVGDDGMLYCLLVDSGQEQWATRVHKKKGTNCSPVVAGGIVVTVGGPRDLVGVSLDDGSELWQHRKMKIWNNSPVVWQHQGTSYVIVGNEELSCIDPSDGSVLWTMPGTDRRKDPSSPAIHGDLMATMFEGSGLRVHRLSTAGAELVATAEQFEAQGGGAHQATSPVFDGERVFGVDGDKTFCFDLAQQTMIWTGPKGDTHASPILVGDKLLVRGKRDAMLFAAETGEQLGTNEMVAAYCSSFALSGSRVVANCGLVVRCWDLSR